jgi:hypothetical protein
MIAFKAGVNGEGVVADIENMLCGACYATYW